jgi:hypothetical protein
MRLNLRAASSLASALPSCRVAFLVGGALLVSESLVLATTLFAAASVSFVASVMIAAKIYRVRAPRPVEAQRDPSYQ